MKLLKLIRKTKNKIYLQIMKNGKIYPFVSFPQQNMILDLNPLSFSLFKHETGEPVFNIA